MSTVKGAVGFAGLFIAAVSPMFADTPPLRLSHAWIVVATGARNARRWRRRGSASRRRQPARGQGRRRYSRVNGFLELMYPDPTVLVSPASRPGPKIPAQGGGVRPAIVRSASSSTARPRRRRSSLRDLECPPVDGEGTFIEMMTLKEMPKAVSLISSHPGARERHRGSRGIPSRARCSSTQWRAALTDCVVVWQRRLRWPRPTSVPRAHEVRRGRPLAARCTSMAASRASPKPSLIFQW
jgi:hypothetical protein